MIFPSPFWLKASSTDSGSDSRRRLRAPTPRTAMDIVNQAEMGQIYSHLLQQQQQLGQQQQRLDEQQRKLDEQQQQLDEQQRKLDEQQKQMTWMMNQLAAQQEQGIAVLDLIRAMGVRISQHINR